MSRIGRLPVPIPSGVKVDIDGQLVTVQGPKGTLRHTVAEPIDVVREDIELPLLEQGDLVVGRMMGAYTWASASEFNLFPRATVLALDRGRLMRDGDWT